MNIIEQLVSEGIAESTFHAAGMLNVLECSKLKTDDERIERCKLYAAWKKYYSQSKEFKSTALKTEARKRAIAGATVPEPPMVTEFQMLTGEGEQA